MEGLKECIARPEVAPAPEPGALDEALARYGWCMPLRLLRARTTGVEDPLWRALAPWRAASSLCQQQPAAADFTAFSSDDLIERFLREEDLRIVAQEGDASDDDVVTEARLDDDDRLVSEELAAIYLAQGLRSEAAAIYRELSLRNPEKSVYFAELIAQVENK